MLVLTRKLQQSIRIGDEITITVLRTKGNAVRLGINAPAEVRVIRSELDAEGEEQEAGRALLNPDAVPVAPSKDVPHGAGADRERLHWPTDGRRGQRAGAQLPGRPPTKIHFERVPRGQTRPANRLHEPKSLGTAPLRHLVERRSVTA